MKLGLVITTSGYLHVVVVMNSDDAIDNALGDTGQGTLATKLFYHYLGNFFVRLFAISCLL